MIIYDSDDKGNVELHLSHGELYEIVNALRIAEIEGQEIDTERCMMMEQRLGGYL